MSPVRVALVDDQELMRTGFRMILETEDDIEVVGEAAEGGAGVELCRRQRPDVVLMDVRMPGVDGIEATRRIVEEIPEVKVLVLTTFDLDDYVFGAMRAGASGFLLKDTPADRLVEAIHVVAGGEALMSPTVTRRLIEAFVESGPAPTTEVQGVGDLTEREVDVLRLVARGLSNAEIAKELILGETTVKTHVSRILMKLGVRDRVQAVVAAYESGVVRPGDNR